VSRLAVLQGKVRSAEQLRQTFQLLSTTQLVAILSTLATLGLVLLLTVGLARAVAAAPAARVTDPFGQLAHLPPPNPLFGTVPVPQTDASQPAPYGAPPESAAPLTQQYPPPYAGPPAPLTRPVDPPAWAAPDVVRRTYQPE
jgi:hypothetical protein